MNLKLRLVDDWEKVHTYSSTQLAATIGTVSVLSQFLEAAWSGMPEEVKSILPDRWRLAIAIFIACLGIIVARYTTNAPKADSEADGKPLSTQTFVASGAYVPPGTTTIGPVVVGEGGAGGAATGVSDGSASTAAK